MECCESTADDTPDDLRNISFDEWDKDFIASFEENVFNLINDDGKNLGFFLSPNGKGNPLLFSPDGKRMTPDAFRKSLGATPSPRMKYTPVIGANLQGFSDQTNSSITGLDSTTMLDMLPMASTQPKKQLFPCEKSVHVSSAAVEKLLFNSDDGWFDSFSDLKHVSHSTQYRLHAARTRFSHVLRNAVEKTAERVKELQASGEMADTVVMVKHPELRQALGTHRSSNLNSETNILANSGDRGAKRPFMSKSSVSTVIKPDPRQVYRRVTRYSRIQPKRQVPQGFNLVRY